MIWRGFSYALRFATVAIATFLLACALLGDDGISRWVLEHVLAFALPGGAALPSIGETLARVAMGVAGAALLTLRGTWIDGLAAVLIVIAVSAAGGDIRHARRVVAATTPTPTPTAAPTASFMLPHKRVVGPVHGGKAVLFVVVQQRSNRQAVTKTETHRYEVTAVDAQGRSQDVAVALARGKGDKYVKSITRDLETAVRFYVVERAG